MDWIECGRHYSNTNLVLDIRNLMTAKELIEEMEWALERNKGNDVEVRFASQPSWPFEYSVREAHTVELESSDGDKDQVVYLVEGAQLAYLNEHAREEIGW